MVICGSGNNATAEFRSLYCSARPFLETSGDFKRAAIRKAIEAHFMETGEDIKAAKVVIQILLKARKNLRMYPSNNPIYSDTLEAAFDKFAAFFALRDKLILKIRLYDIYYENEIIYHNDLQKDDNLAFFLFKDGLRELSFQKKMPFDEMTAFLKIISQDFENEVLDDDTVTLFWEKDFQYIRYIVEDEFLADENYEESAVSFAKEKENDPPKFKAILDQPPAIENRAREVAIISIEDEDMKVLERDLEADANDDKIDKFLQIIFEMLYKSKTPAEFSEIADFFNHAIEYAVSVSNIDAVSNILERLKQILSRDELPGFVKENIEKVFDFAGSEHVIYLLGECLDTGDKTDPTPIKNLITYFDKTAIPPFMNLLSSLRTIHARKAIIDILVILCPLDFITVTKGLNSPEWYVVRNIIYVLRAVGDPRAVEHLLKKTDHPDPRVRLEVIRTLGELGDARCLPALEACLSDGVENQLRFTAIRAIGTIASEEARRVLAGKIVEKSFDNKAVNEKKEYFQVLSRWKDKKTIALMIGILVKKGYFSSSKIDENRACAAFGLGLIGAEEALPHLYKCQNARNKLLSEFSAAAIKRIENDIQKSH